MSEYDAQAIIDVAQAATEPSVLDNDLRHSVIVPEGGQLQIIDPLEDEFRDAPRRRKGVATVYDVDSLASLWSKQSLTESELYGDPVGFTLTAVINADQTAGADAGFRDYLIRLVCKKTPAWEAWAALDGKQVNQLDFAEFLEDRLPEVVQPSGAEMLELAQSFEATTKVDFKSAQIVSSGQRALVYDETTQAKAGQSGQIEIPTTFQIAVQPFEGSDAYKVTARFRYRIREGRLTIGYKLDRPEDVLREAFKDVRQAASEACDRPVLLGSPAPGR